MTEMQRRIGAALCEHRLPGGAVLQIRGGTIGEMRSGIENELVARSADAAHGVEGVVPIAFGKNFRAWLVGLAKKQR